MDDVMRALGNCRLFKGKKKEELERYMTQSNIVVKKIWKNKFVIDVGKTFPYLGVIVRGVVEVQKPLTTGNIVCMSYKKQGDIFGGAVIFSQKNWYPCDVYAKEDGEVLFIHKKSLLNLVQEDITIAGNLLELFGDSVLFLEHRLELLSYSSIKQKIAFYLINHILQSDNITVVLPFSKKTWADYLNVSRPSLCRELKVFCDNQVLSISKNSISVLDKEHLERLLVQ